MPDVDRHPARRRSAASALWAGTTLVLSQLRWFSRPPLVDRLRPYSPGGHGRRRPPRRHPVGRVVPRRRRPAVPQRWASGWPGCSASARSCGIRLERIHSTDDVTALPGPPGRVEPSPASARRRCWPSPCGPPPPVALLFVLGGPLLGVPRARAAAGVGVRRLAAAALLELPVVAEQLAMLLSAGFSLGAALNRLAGRGGGNVARDLARVCGRIRQGLTEVEALREWAEVADVEALNRLVPCWPSTGRRPTSGASSPRRPAPSARTPTAA